MTGRARAIATLETYYGAFNGGDQEAMLACLTEDVAHDINQGQRETGATSAAADVDPSSVQLVGAELCDRGGIGEQQIHELVVGTSRSEIDALVPFQDARGPNHGASQNALAFGGRPRVAAESAEHARESGFELGLHRSSTYQTCHSAAPAAKLWDAFHADAIPLKVCAGSKNAGGGLKGML